MARFSSESIERVRAAADVVEVMAPYTDLRRQGARLTGLCPFHDERTPSFSVDPQAKVYYCFGCETAGDIFTFVEQKEGLSFPEAVEALAERYGVEVERQREDPRAEQARRRRQRLHELLGRAATFYAAYLWSEAREAARAREYLEGRRLGEPVLRDFGAGLAPSAWDQLLTRGQRAGFTVEELRAAGLAQRGGKGGVYDRFRERIMFPVRDAQGRVLGFGARALRENQPPKYLNSPEGELYHKGRTLFGIERAKAAIARADEALVVEGYTDALALHQAGFENAVAVMGTAITPEQLAMLSAHAATVTLALDADRSGQEAMLRAQRAARDRKMRLRVLRLPEGKDPSELLASEPPERFRELVEGAVELAEFRVASALERADLASPAGRDRALAEIAPVLAEMGESIAREELTRRVADRIDVPAGMLGGMLREAAASQARLARVASGEPGSRAAAGGEPGSGGAPGRAGDPGGGAAAPTAAERRMLTPHERRERALLAMCIASPEAGREYLARLTPAHLSSPEIARARDWLAEHLESPLKGLPREEGELASLVTQLAMAAEREPAPRHALELNFLLLEQQLIEHQIAAASGGGEGEAELELKRLVHRRDELVEARRQVELREG